MTETATESTNKTRNRWLVVVGALLVQLALGSVYAFSIFTSPLSKELGYKSTSFQILGIFATAIAVFAVTMILGGRLQDKRGPKLVATVGGVIYAISYALAYLSTDSIAMMYLSYGIVGGIGLGMTYMCPLSAAIKWYPDKKGLVSGIAVAGFGAGSFLFTQVGKRLIANQNIGLDGAFLYLGAIFFVMVVGGAQLLRNPPAGWKPKGWVCETVTSGGKMVEQCEWSRMIRTRTFVFLWMMFAIASTAGLMMISNVKNVAIYLDPTQTSMAVAEFQTIAGILALFNGAGRITWGRVSDRFGRLRTMKLMFIAQAAILFAAAAFCYVKPAGDWTQFIGLTSLASLVGFTFGGNFALFPSTTADFFGTKHLGNNYGLVFTAYGAGGILGALIPGLLAGSTSGFVWVFLAVGIGSLVAFGIASITRSPELAPLEAETEKILVMEKATVDD